MNEGLSFGPAFADAESLLTFAIAPGFQCPFWCVKTTAVMPGAMIPATPAPSAASAVQTLLPVAHGCHRNYTQTPLSSMVLKINPSKIMQVGSGHICCHHMSQKTTPEFQFQHLVDGFPGHSTVFFTSPVATLICLHVR